MSDSSDDLVWKELHHLRLATEARARGDMAAVARNNVEARFAANRQKNRLKRLGVRIDLPKDKDYPPDAIQCDNCGGHGCGECVDRGWFEKDHPKGRRCERPVCSNPIPPSQVEVYCSNDCAARDASDENV